MYTDFASVYDQLMRETPYEAWAAHYAALLRERGVTAGRVTECACGTGNLTIPLARRGFAMTGVDLSEQMLRVAAGKSRAAGLPVAWVRMDMRALALHRPCDAVLCTCDGLNYVTAAGARRFFAAAYAALRPGGVLALDVSSEYKLREVLGGRTLCEDGEDIAYFWKNAWRAGGVDMALSIFVRESDGRYARIDERQRQHAHTIEGLTAALEAAGFAGVRAYGGLRMTPPRARDERIHITAARPETHQQSEAIRDE